jgi:hypothetical protein
VLSQKKVCTKILILFYIVLSFPHAMTWIPWNLVGNKSLQWTNVVKEVKSEIAQHQELGMLKMLFFLQLTIQRITKARKIRKIVEI